MPKAVVLTGYVPPDVLVWRNIPLPEPGPGQVRIRVKAAGVSPIDTKIRHGDVQAVFPLPPEAILGIRGSWRGRRDWSVRLGRTCGDNVASLLAGHAE
jgi:NADPH:quinone reductase-like Zn-dependent oxidoreductase